MKIMIEIKNDLVGYLFEDGNDNVVRFEDLSRLEQVRVLNSFVSGYELFRRVLKEKEE